MKNFYFSVITLLIISSVGLAQTTESTHTKKVYDPSDNAEVAIDKAVNQAAQEGKHVLLQIGGNWCRWCLAFDQKVSTIDTLKNEIEANYVVYHVNHSKENWNWEVLKTLDYPQRFGFPVFVILDGKGNRLHTQNSEYLEEGKGHSTNKILQFLKHWSPTAIDAKNYK
jgi:thioredoxin-related protein